MDDKLFKELEANLKEAVKVAKGASKPKSIYVVLTPAQNEKMEDKRGRS